MFMLPTRIHRSAGQAIVVIGLAIAAFCLPSTASAAGKSARVVAAPVQDAGEYAGQDTCLTCHEDQSYKGTSHALVSNPRTPASGRGCESCHGPGKAHADAGGDASKIIRLGQLKAQEASVYCTSCHDRGTHALWAGSQHDQRNVGCISCHSVHAPKGAKMLKAANQSAEQIAQTLKDTRHLPGDYTFAIGGVMLVIGLVFVYRSFYGMRIQSEDNAITAPKRAHA